MNDETKAKKELPAKQKAMGELRSRLGKRIAEVEGFHEGYKKEVQKNMDTDPNFGSPEQLETVALEVLTTLGAEDPAKE